MNWASLCRVILGMSIITKCWLHLLWNHFPGGGVPGHAGKQRSGRLRPGGAEGDGPVLLCADCQTASHQVEPRHTGDLLTVFSVEMMVVEFCSETSIMRTRSAEVGRKTQTVRLLFFSLRWHQCDDRDCSPHITSSPSLARQNLVWRLNCWLQTKLNCQFYN